MYPEENFVIKYYGDGVYILFLFWLFAIIFGNLHQIWRIVKRGEGKNWSKPTVIYLHLTSIGQLLFIFFPLSLPMFTDFSKIAFKMTFDIISYGDLLQWTIRCLCYFLTSQGVIMTIYAIINALTVYRESSLIEEPKFVNTLLLTGGVLGPVPIVAYTFVAEPSYFPLTYQSYNTKQFLMLVTWNIFQMCLIISSIAQISTMILFVIRKQFKLATRSFIIFLILIFFWKYIPEIEPETIDTYIGPTDEYDYSYGLGVGNIGAYLEYMYEKLGNDYNLIADTYLREIWEYNDIGKFLVYLSTALLPILRFIVDLENK